MPEQPAIEIRPLRPDEWTLLRALRLRALHDAPDAFGPAFADVAREPDRYWQTGARRIAESEAQLFVAEAGTSALGLVHAAADAARVGHLGAMWVAPEARGSGLARRMLRAALDALEAQGCERVELWVTGGNGAAVSLYEGFGFRFTGGERPLRDGSPLRNLEMARVRAGSA